MFIILILVRTTTRTQDPASAGAEEIGYRLEEGIAGNTSAQLRPVTKVMKKV
jgi:hypothetical protein